MGDLIRRQDAIKHIKECHYASFDYGYIAGTYRAIKIIEDLPSAEPKTSKLRHYEGVLTCMECGAEFYDDIMEYTGDEVPHFCPDCGANMEAKE